MFLRLLLTFAAVIVLCSQALAAGGVAKSTHVYKTADGVPIHADVYLPSTPGPFPVLVWLHGGALIVGNRESVPKPLVDLAEQEGYLLVSFDYRLAPEVKLPAIIDDVRDGLTWIRREGREKFNADPQRLVVTGGSAGGYLTLMTGCAVEPRPTALVAYWGYGDVDGAWIAEASDFYRNQTPLVSDAEVRGVTGGHVFTGTDAAQAKARGSFYRWLRQHGGWTQEVSGFDSNKDRDKLDRYCPVRQVSSGYPPTLLIHGTADTDVPYERSVEMAAALKAKGVPHELITVEGAGHGLAGAKREQVRDVNQRVARFVRQHLGTKAPAVVGHRGLLFDAPENTLAGFKACIALNIGFEFDVQRAKDGELVCIHDATVKRTTDGKGRVAELTADQLSRLNAAAAWQGAFPQQSVPTLKDVLHLIAEHPHWAGPAAVDLKGADEQIEADVVRLAKEQGVLDRLVFIGRAITIPAVRARLRAADPACHVAVLAKDEDELSAAIADRDSDWVYVRAIPSATARDQIRRAGKTIFLVGPLVAVNDPQNWREAAGAGVSAILTDYPVECRRVLRAGR